MQIFKTLQQIFRPPHPDTNETYLRRQLTALRQAQLAAQQAGDGGHVEILDKKIGHLERCILDEIRHQREADAGYIVEYDSW